MKFSPVQAKETTFKVKAPVDLYPEMSIISLNKVEEKESRMITLSPQAIKALGLTEEENRIGIIKGYKDEEQTQEALFIYKTLAKTVPYVRQVNTKAIKLDTASINLNTRRAMSSKYHNYISVFHSKAAENCEKMFTLASQYDETYWLLEEYTPSEGNEETTIISPPSEDEEVNLEHAGETAEVTLD